MAETARLVSVPLTAPFADLIYAFKTIADTATSTILGHTAVTIATPVTGLIYRANHPKPKRASKTFPTEVRSSFVAPAAIAAAVAAGWNVSKAKSNGRKSNTARQVALYVTLNGINYGWGMSKKRWTNGVASSAAALGIKQITTENDIVFGATFPKPPRVAGFTGKNGDKRVSSFYDPSNAAAAQGLNPSPGNYLDISDIL